MIWLFVGTFAVLFALGMPIAFAMGLASVFYIVLQGQVDIGILVQKFTVGADSFPLLAIPLFMMAADLMNESGITTKLFDFAHSMVGRIKGGLGHANVIGSMIFAGMSGSAAADAAGLGSIEIKAMSEKGFDRPFAAATTAASSVVGPIIPPSIPMEVYASIAQVSVGKLFLGGMIPGILMGLAMCIIVYWRAVQRNYPSQETSWAFFWQSLKSAFLALLTPVILLGGIYTGLCTPTEAAALAALYALVVGVLVYKKITWETFKRILLNTVKGTAAVIIIVASANMFAWILTREQIPIKLTEGLMSVSTNPMVMMVIFNVILLIAGAFMELYAIMTLLLPVMLPVVKALGIDTVYFGVVMIFNLMIGQLTPPFGMGIFITSVVSNTPIAKIIKELWPYIFVLTAVLFLITFFPGLIMFLPNLYR